MAYVRMGEEGSDVYVYSDGEAIVCCGCALRKVELTNEYIHRRDALSHLELHRTFGHTVPEYVFERLRYEIEELGNCVDGNRLDGEKLVKYMFLREPPKKK